MRGVLRALFFLFIVLFPTSRCGVLDFCWSALRPARHDTPREARPQTSLRAWFEVAVFFAYFISFFFILFFSGPVACRHPSTHTSKQASKHGSLEASEQASERASKPESKQASRQARKQARTEACKRASKQASTETGKLASKRASKQARKQASKEGRKEGCEHCVANGPPSPPALLLSRAKRASKPKKLVETHHVSIVCTPPPTPLLFF